MHDQLAARVIELLERQVTQNYATNKLLYELVQDQQTANVVAAKQLLIQHRILFHMLGGVNIIGFQPIYQENTMVPLQAGQIAVFASPNFLPENATVTKKPSWSSDKDFAPAVQVDEDSSGLSARVAFADDTPFDTDFTLSLTYTNANGDVATQANTFRTAPAPPPPVVNVTGFADIIQTA